MLWTYYMDWCDADHAPEHVFKHVTITSDVLQSRTSQSQSDYCEDIGTDSEWLNRL